MPDNKPTRLRGGGVRVDNSPARNRRNLERLARRLNSVKLPELAGNSTADLTKILDDSVAKNLANRIIAQAPKFTAPKEKDANSRDIAKQIRAEKFGNPKLGQQRLSSESSLSKPSSRRSSLAGAPDVASSKISKPKTRRSVEKEKSTESASSSRISNYTNNSADEMNDIKSTKNNVTSSNNKVQKPKSRVREAVPKRSSGYRKNVESIVEDSDLITSMAARLRQVEIRATSATKELKTQKAETDTLKMTVSKAVERSQQLEQQVSAQKAENETLKGMLAKAQQLKDDSKDKVIADLKMQIDELQNQDLDPDRVIQIIEQRDMYKAKYEAQEKERQRLSKQIKKFESVLSEYGVKIETEVSCSPELSLDDSGSLPNSSRLIYDKSLPNTARFVPAPELSNVKSARADANSKNNLNLKKKKQDANIVPQNEQNRNVESKKIEMAEKIVEKDVGEVEADGSSDDVQTESIIEKEIRKLREKNIKKMEERVPAEELVEIRNEILELKNDQLKNEIMQLKKEKTDVSSVGAIYTTRSPELKSRDFEQDIGFGYKSAAQSAVTTPRNNIDTVPVASGSKSPVVARTPKSILKQSSLESWESNPVNEVSRTNANEESAVDYNLLKSRVEELNERMELEERQITTNGQISGFKSVDDNPLKIMFFSDGILLESVNFAGYGSDIANIIIRDLLDGFFPFVLQESYPDGVKLECVDCTRLSHSEWLSTKPIDVEQFLMKLPEKVVKNGLVVDVRNSIAERIKNSSYVQPSGDFKDRLQEIDSLANSKESFGSVDPTWKVPKEEISCLKNDRSEKDPICRIAVRVPGGRLRLKMEATATIEELRFAIERFYGLPSRQGSRTPKKVIMIPSYELVAPLPDRQVYNALNLTLEEAGLMPASTIQLRETQQ